MAEKVLKYKIELDSSDLAGQLDSIRERVSQAVNSQSGGASTFSSLGGGAATPSGFAVTAPSFAVPEVLQSTSQFQNTFANTVNNSLNEVKDFASRISDVAQVGFQRMSGSMATNAGDFSLSTREQNISNSSFLGQAMGGLGAGYDPNSSVGYNEYRSANADQFARSVTNFGMDNFSKFSGALGGLMLGGPAGAVIGGLAGWGQDLAKQAVMSPARQAESLAGGLQSLASSSFGNMSMDDAIGMANGILSRPNGVTDRLQGIDSQVAQTAIMDFGAAGGFKGVSNAEEFRKEADDVVSNLRLFQNAFNTTMQEATQIMASIKQSGVQGTDGIGAWGAQFAGTASSMGQSPTQFLNTVTHAGNEMQAMGLLGAQNLVNPAQSFQSGLESILRSGAQYEGFAGQINKGMSMGDRASMVSSSQNAAMMQGPGSLGFWQAAEFGTSGNVSIMPRDVLNSASSLMQNPMNVLSSMATQGMNVQAMGPQNRADAALSDVIGFFESTNRSFTPQAFLGATMLMKGVDARTGMGMMMDAAFGAENQNLQTVAGAYNAYQDLNSSSRSGPVTHGIATAYEGISTAVDRVFAPLGALGRSMVGGGRDFTEGLADWWGNKTTTKFTGRYTEKQLKQGIDILTASDPVSEAIRGSEGYQDAKEDYIGSILGEAVYREGESEVYATQDKSGRAALSDWVVKNETVKSKIGVKELKKGLNYSQILQDTRDAKSDEEVPDFATRGIVASKTRQSRKEFGQSMAGMDAAVRKYVEDNNLLADPSNKGKVTFGNAEDYLSEEGKKQIGDIRLGVFSGLGGENSSILPNSSETIGYNIGSEQLEKNVDIYYNNRNKGENIIKSVGASVAVTKKQISGGDIENALEKMGEEGLISNVRDILGFMGGWGDIDTAEEYSKFTKMLINKGVDINELSVNVSAVGSKQSSEAMANIAEQITNNKEGIDSYKAGLAAEDLQKARRMYTAAFDGKKLSAEEERAVNQMANQLVAEGGEIVSYDGGAPNMDNNVKVDIMKQINDKMEDNLSKESSVFGGKDWQENLRQFVKKGEVSAMQAAKLQASHRTRDALEKFKFTDEEGYLKVVNYPR